VAKQRITISAIHKVSKSIPESLIIDEYIKRIPWGVAIKQLDSKLKLPAKQQQEYEGELLLKSIPSGSFIIAMDERGSKFTSQEFSSYIQKKISQPISFIIGGAHGLSEEVRDKSDFLLSLSDMTMPHLLARAMLVEQIYRAYTISQNHPYHK
jgi:23S rRNA (pseudouridine1915-N3)-methyltransferase